ncbi:MAG TPA: hypothetical protein ENN60_02170 [archaeon]|nr:hypothetical protein [archaeon]
MGMTTPPGEATFFSAIKLIEKASKYAEEGVGTSHVNALLFLDPILDKPDLSRPDRQKLMAKVASLHDPRVYTSTIDEFMAGLEMSYSAWTQAVTQKPEHEDHYQDVLKAHFGGILDFSEGWDRIYTERTLLRVYDRLETWVRIKERELESNYPAGVALEFRQLYLDVLDSRNLSQSI